MKFRHSHDFSEDQEDTAKDQETQDEDQEEKDACNQSRDVPSCEELLGDTKPRSVVLYTVMQHAKEKSNMRLGGNRHAFSHVNQRCVC